MKHAFLTHTRRIVPLAYQSVGYGNGASAGTLDISAPSGVVDKSLLVGFMATGNTGAGWNTLAGWTAIGTPSGRAAMFYRIAGASEPGTYTFTRAAGGNNSRGLIFRCEGHDLTTPIAAAAMEDNTNGNAPDVTATQANSLLVSLALNVGTNTTDPGEPAGMTALFQSLATAFRAGAGKSVNAGAVGMQDWTVPLVVSAFANVVINKA